MPEVLTPLSNEMLIEQAEEAMAFQKSVEYVYLENAKNRLITARKLEILALAKGNLERHRDVLSEMDGINALFAQVNSDIYAGERAKKQEARKQGA